MCTYVEEWEKDTRYKVKLSQLQIGYTCMTKIFNESKTTTELPILSQSTINSKSLSKLNVKNRQHKQVLWQLSASLADLLNFLIK